MKRPIVKSGIAAGAALAALAGGPAVGVPAFTASAAPSAAPECPTGADGSTMECGVQTVSGLGANKQKILDAGGTTADIAQGMMETETLDTDYPYGDNKTGDAANFGIAKQNWMMLRGACDEFAGQSEDEFDDGAVLNDDLELDLSCLHQSQQHYGDAWLAGHRNGSSGLENPDTEDIQNFKAAHAWAQEQLESDEANQTNDTRFWVDVPAI